MLSEFNFIQQLKKFQLKRSDVFLGIGDDTAVLSASRGQYQLLTTDMLVHGVHFTSQTNPCAIGYKAMACNVSDISAMGGLGCVAVVSIGVPKKMSFKYVEAIYQGMYRCAKMFDISIVGGDTVQAKQLVINVALLGKVEKKNLVLRSGAKVGDSIFVTGALGGSLKSQRHLNFIPRVKEARFLVQYFKPTSMMDISDGLAGDLRHILTASHVGAVLNEKEIPCYQGVSVKEALTDGEDFELLFTIPSRLSKKLIEYKKPRGMKITHIGYITKDVETLQLCSHGRLRELTLKAYTHF